MVPRKLSDSFRSARGMQAYATLATVLFTSHSLLHFLQNPSSIQQCPQTLDIGDNLPFKRPNTLAASYRTKEQYAAHDREIASRR